MEENNEEFEDIFKEAQVEKYFSSEI